MKIKSVFTASGNFEIVDVRIVRTQTRTRLRTKVSSTDKWIPFQCSQIQSNPIQAMTKQNERSLIVPSASNEFLFDWVRQKSSTCYPQGTICIHLKTSPGIYRISSHNLYGLLNYMEGLATLNEIKTFFNRVIIDAPLETTGIHAGYTWLHWACIEKNIKMVKLLIEEYNVDVNVTAADGIQPIHIVFFLGCENARWIDIISSLANAGANMNTKLNVSLIRKFKGNFPSYFEFRNDISLLTYAISIPHFAMARCLIDSGTDVKIISYKNQTLLMYALKNIYLLEIGIEIAKRSNNLKYINARDNDDVSAIHYLLHPSSFVKDRYEKECDTFNLSIVKALRVLIESGADINATVNGNSDTLLLNMAAYRCYDTILKELLPRHIFITKSKALFNVTLPFEDHGIPDRHVLFQRRQKCTELILKDLINRSSFGLQVPKEEKQLMDNLIMRDNYIKVLVNTYEKEFIRRVLKNNMIECFGKSITHYDFILLCSNEIKLRPLVRGETFLTCFEKFFNTKNYDDYLYFNVQLKIKMKNACKRVELLEKLKKIGQLRKAIPLSYELVLDITEYLENYEFEFLLQAFYL